MTNLNVSTGLQAPGRGRRVLTEYAAAHGLHEPPMTLIADVLADLMHLARTLDEDENEGFDDPFEIAYVQAQDRFAEEVDELEHDARRAGESL